MKLLFAGDWHGDEDWAGEVIARAAETGCGWVVQVGDFGFGFFRLGDDPAEPGDWAPRCPFACHVSTLAADAGVRVVFIDGNHDNQVLLGRLAALRGADGEEGFVPVEDNLWWGHCCVGCDRVAARLDVCAAVGPAHRSIWGRSRGSGSRPR